MSMLDEHKQVGGLLASDLLDPDSLMAGGGDDAPPAAAPSAANFRGTARPRKFTIKESGAWTHVHAGDYWRDHASNQHSRAPSGGLNGGDKAALFRFVRISRQSGTLFVNQRERLR